MQDRKVVQDIYNCPKINTTLKIQCVALSTYQVHKGKLHFKNDKK